MSKVCEAKEEGKMEKGRYSLYPDGYKKLIKELKMPFYLRFIIKRIFPLFIKILADG